MQQESQKRIGFSFLEKQRQKSLNQIRKRRQQVFLKSRQLFEESDKSQCLQSAEDSQIIQQNKSQMIDQIDEPTHNINESSQSQKSTNNKSKKTNKGKFNFNIKKIFQVPDWMNQVPEQLSSFYGAARPSGTTVLLIIQNDNQLQVYDKLGVKIKNYKLKGKTFKDTILQGFYLTNKNQKGQETKSIIISDMIKWKGNIYSAESFEFRYSWLMANFHSLASLTQIQCKLLSYLPMNKQTLAKIYFQKFSYEKQGLYFIHKDSFYLHGNNSSALIWKDYKVSKYPIDQTTDDCIVGTGFLKINGSVATSDNFIVGKLNADQLIGYSKCLIRFKIKGLNFTSVGHENQFVQFIGFEPINIKKLHFSRPDPLSRIIFQFRMRNDPLTIEQIASKIN